MEDHRRQWKEWRRRAGKKDFHRTLWKAMEHQGNRSVGKKEGDGSHGTCGSAQPRECKTLFWEKEHSRSTAMGRPWESWKLLEHGGSPSTATSRIV